MKIKAIALGAIMALTAGTAFAGEAKTSWTGCYVGVHVGHQWHDTSITIPGMGSASLGDSSDWTGGGHVGCDMQLGKVVAGIMGDATFGSAAMAGGAYKVSTSYGLMGRAGYLMSPELLPYVLAGYTWANTSSNVITALPDIGGWTLGGGVEWMPAAMRGFSVRVEYRYTDYGLDPLLAGLAFTDNYSHDIRAGVSYRF